MKLKAKTPAEKTILDYLKANVGSMLEYKIDHGTKTLAGAYKYITAEAKKLTKKEGSVMVDDATVYGWAIHYFEEDSIKEEKPKKAAKVPGKVKVEAKLPKIVPPPVNVTMDLFSTADGEPF